MALRCFVAMALGHQDTDKVYDDLIAPTLRNRGVTPIRIDRIEFNEDIDDRIILELQRCDFALADLTYARPSVYFEAGFAQRKVPVVYTCRKDHLYPEADDAFGNFRVHFDLQMKNIIPWSSPSSRDFAKRLTRRIDQTIRPLLRLKESERAERQEAEQFSVLSVEDRVKRILTLGISQFEIAGYKEIVGETNPYIGDGFPVPIPYGLFDRWQTARLQFRRILPLEARWLGMKSVGGTVCTVFLHVAATITKKLLALLYDSLLVKPIYNLSPQTERGTISRLDEHIFVYSLQKVATSRVMLCLPDFHFEPDHAEFIRMTKQVVPKGRMPEYSEVYALAGNIERGPFLLRNPKEAISGLNIFAVHGRSFQRYGNAIGATKTITRHIHVHIIDTIKSEGAFLSTLSAVLQRNQVL